MDGPTSEEDLQDAIALKVFDDDETALTDILMYYAPRIEGALLGVFEGRLTAEDIEEVVSDAVRKFWKARGSYDDRKGSIRAFLYVIAKNRALDVLRLGWQKARQLEVSVEKEFLENACVEECHLGSVPEEELPSEARAKLEAAVRETLAELPDAQRRILEEDAMAEGDIDAAELGRRLGGLPAGTIRVYRMRAREAFRKGMKKRGYEL
jgi:RNA polymerase sigma-70 factor (ECF subfamily)